MSRPKKYRVHLSNEDVDYLKKTLRNPKTALTVANRCRILLDLDEDHPPVKNYVQCVETYGVSRATIATVARKYCEGGIPLALKLNRSINSDNARRKVDGRIEAKLIEVACGPAPEGHSRWTIRLLENEMKAVLDEPISRETIRRTLKKTGLNLTEANTGVSLKKQTPVS